MNASPQTSNSCPKCGRPLTALNANFCTYCGTTIQMPAVVDEEERYVGQVIDDSFRVEGKIGVGSMGVVYRAMQMSLNKPVALKILRRAFVTDPVVMERFKREAQAASRLQHPNTINVLHFGATDDGSPYIAMEFLEGADLSDVVSQEFPLGSKRVVSLMSQVCQALQEAHNQGIIHRDLKPANIVVARRRDEEIVKVLDFGIAKIQDAEGQGLTRDGLVCGTPAFMSPEQVSGHPVDHRSDLFSLGIILYYMLSGQLPFAGNSAVEMASAILMDTPKVPSRVRLGAMVAPEIEDVCMKAIAKEPGQRYQSADEFRRALEAAFHAHEDKGGDARLEGMGGMVAGGANADVLQGHGVATVMHQAAMATPAPAQSRGTPRWLVAVVAVLVLAAIAGVVLVALTRGGDTAADGATTPDENELAFDAETLTPATQIGTVGGTLGAVWRVEPGPDQNDTGEDTTDPTLNFTLDTEGEAGEGEDGEEIEGEGEDGEETELSRSEKRALKRQEAAELFAKADKIWRSDPQRAIRLLKRATRLNSRDAKAWELLGDAYVRVAKRRDAAKAYQKVLEINPNHKRKRILQKQIEAGGL